MLRTNLTTIALLALLTVCGAEQAKTPAEAVACEDQYTILYGPGYRNHFYAKCLYNNEHIPIVKYHNNGWVSKECICKEQQ